ncbi:MAG: AAA family ATPase [Pseudomonadales bacterium]
MKRRQLDYIKEWVNRKTRKPLIIRGARQVGKTTLVQLACKEMGLELIELNMEDSQEFPPLLPQNDPHKVFQAIALSKQLSDINPDKHLFFFDEAQACSALIPFLRYCFERAPEYRVILTGSLLEFVLEADKHFLSTTAEGSSFPVGRVEFLYLGPMTFEEYLSGTNNEAAVELLQQVSVEKPFNEAIHNTLLKHLRNYLIVGGMPEAINAYRETQSYLDVERTKQSIITTYQADFHKYGHKADTHLLNRVLTTIPLQLGKKVMYSRLSEGTRSDQVKRTLELLELAKVIQRCCHSHGDGLPLNAQQKTDHFKLVFLDVGLLQSMLGISLAAIETTEEINEIAKGVLAEQFVGQHLMYNRPMFEAPSIHYWERQVKHSTAEVDYLVPWNQQVLPVEVKSGHKGHMKSLQQFLLEKKANRALRFSSGPLLLKDYEHAGKALRYRFLNVPHYLVEQWARLAEAL